MKIVSFSSIGGASGDMILGSLIGLGADVKTIDAAIKKLLPDENLTIRTENIVSKGIAGLRAIVEIVEEHHHHHHDHHEEHVHHHHHRKLNDILTLIEKSPLSDSVKTMSSNVFRNLAAAEAKVHGTTPEEIHFHEVGAVDSIADIVGCCLAFEMLGAEKIFLSPLPEGQGFLKCQHGIMPIPAPATAELMVSGKLRSFQTDEPFELVTPTGAALLSTWEKVPAGFTGTTLSVSNSFGSRELQNRPNLLRASLVELTDEAAPFSDSCLVLETNIDDTTPEIMGLVFDKLLASGALDAFVTPVIMKKNRPGFLLTTLCRAEDSDAISRIIFAETGTFGIRMHESSRKILKRSFKTVDTAHGRVRIKVGGYCNDSIIVATPEMGDCVELASMHGLPVRTVYNEAVAAASKEVGSDVETHDRKKDSAG